MTLSIIVAMSQNRVIGKNNRLPWHLSEDLKRFKVLTMGHPILMGRKTYESIGRPLPGRTNLVLTRNSSFHAEGITRVGSLEEALQKAGDAPEMFVIGGTQIYSAVLQQADKIYLTRIEKEVEGDAFFPEVKWEDYTLIEETPVDLSEKEKIPYRFLTYLKK